MSEIFFHDFEALLERLSNGLRKRSQEVVFLVGSPLAAPCRPGLPGVPGVEGIIDLIRVEFDSDPPQCRLLNTAMNEAGPDKYQAAFQFLLGRRGQKTANEIVRKAVLAARISGTGSPGHPLAESEVTDESCRLIDLDIRGWEVSPGAEALGKLASSYPAQFGRSILTTNFDPLIEVAIQRAAGSFFRTTLHADGNLSQTEGTGCHVIHLHGYWYGSDTLHTNRQLGQPRPHLKASLSSLLRNKLVVVCAYSGWDDSFTEALIDVVRDDSAYPEILWTFYSSKPALSDSLAARLTPGINRGRVNLYAGIDCHEFFPRLCAAWAKLESPVPLVSTPRSNAVRVTAALVEELTSATHQKTVVEGDDEDRPPLVEICVGREPELQAIKTSQAKVVFLTGFGGQGKSTVAAQYFADCQKKSTGFSFFVWRDCKEEGERFENQIASVIEKLSNGRISAVDLAKQSARSTIEILITLLNDLDVLFVFDNADHYVDIESQKMTGSADAFIELFLGSAGSSRVLFTCRPLVTYDNDLALSRHLQGLDLDASRRLFAERKASSTGREIESAHDLTEGHAFWLDLLAIQVAKRDPRGGLDALVKEIRSGGGLLPDKTLNSIWTTLHKREQAVLRAMAETVRPETEIQISDYLSAELTYHKVTKALKTLRSLNLVVIKPQRNGPDFLELHPLVRHFIRQSFRPDERLSYITAIIRTYQHFIGNHRSHLADRPSLSILQYWTQNAELDIAAGRIKDAFLTLQEVANPFMSSAYPREFARVTRLLFSQANWATHYEKFKGFELVFKAHTRNLSYLGEYKEVDLLLDNYEKTVPNKDARYINFCEMRCFSSWVRHDFTKAVEWGKIGKNLKDSSDIDIRSDMAHSLALAERDAGQPESALPFFLGGRALSDVTDPDELDEKRGGAHYGNIGRCLHFMGQIDPALVCYQKSALLIEKDHQHEHVTNQAFIRTWIGELLSAREQFKLAYIFMLAAQSKWKQVSPPRAVEVLRFAKQIHWRIEEPLPARDEKNAEKICLDWILGRNVNP